MSESGLIGLKNEQDKKMKKEKMMKNLINDFIGNINRENRLILPNPVSDNWLAKLECGNEESCRSIAF